MERFVEDFAKSVGVRESPLFIPVDRLTDWPVIPQGRRRYQRGGTAACLRKDEGRLSLCRRRRSPCRCGRFPPFPQASPGCPRHRVGVGGYRPHVIAALDPGVAMVALLGGKVDAAAAGVAEVLGPLASRTENDERLRSTVKFFFPTGSSFKAAAEELNLHANSVKYRVSRAIERDEAGRSPMAGSTSRWRYCCATGTARLSSTGANIQDADVFRLVTS